MWDQKKTSSFYSLVILSVCYGFLRSLSATPADLLAGDSFSWENAKLPLSVAGTVTLVVVAFAFWEEQYFVCLWVQFEQLIHSLISGRSRIAQVGANSKFGAKPIIWQIFAKNCLKMKEIGPRWSVQTPLPGSVRTLKHIFLVPTYASPLP